MLPMLIMRPPSPIWRTAAPSAGSRLAMAAPMLREPPVTNATFPMSVFDIVFFPFGSFRLYRPGGGIHSSSVGVTPAALDTDQQFATLRLGLRNGFFDRHRWRRGIRQAHRFHSSPLGVWL